MKKLRFVSAVLSLLVSAVPVWAAVTSVTQTLAAPNDVYTTTVTLSSFSEITIQTWGYAGGTNANGVTIPGGGFDPAVALFLGTSPTATLYRYNDDGFCPPGNIDATSGQCLDSTLRVIGAAPGNYTLVLTAAPNQPNGPTLGDGFTGGGSFTDAFGNVRNNYFAVDIVVTPAVRAQVITFGNLANRGLGTGAFGLTAANSSGLPVTFSSNTTAVCTVSAATVTLIALGTCSITASQAGNSNYAPAASVTQTFLVYTAPSVTIESPPTNATLSLTAEISGWALENTTVVGSNAIRSVAILVDGVQAGTAIYGISRPDVCTTYPGRVGCPNVGWNYELNVTSLAPGRHTLDVVATDSAGNTGSNQLIFNKVQPSVNIDKPAADATLSGMVPISGWALESISAPGPYAISSVTVLVDGNQMGTATYGGARPDVCTMYPGRQGCPNVGWNYNLNVGSLRAGFHTLKIVATDTAGNVASSQLAFNSTNKIQNLTITTTSLMEGVVGEEYSQTLTASGGTSPYLWTVVSGRLPPGLSLNSATGQINGVPTNPTASVVTFQVTDSSLPSQSATAVIDLSFTSNMLIITTITLPNGRIGVPYFQMLQTVGGTGPLTWALNPGAALPLGLILNSATGAITGTPTAPVTSFRFLIRVTDATVPVPQTATAAFVLTISD